MIKTYFGIGLPGGHIIPGLGLILDSLWIYFSVLRNYKTTKGDTKKAFVALAAYAQSNGFPLESYLKVSVAVLLSAYYLTAPYNFGFNLHHTLIVVALGLSGITDLFLVYGCNLPDGIDYAMLTFFHVVAGFSFENHLHGSQTLILAHKLLSSIFYMSALSCLVEWKYRGNLLAAVFRPFCTMMSGTWLCMIGIILYLVDIGVWHPDTQRDLILATSFFILNAIGVILIWALLGYVYHRVYDARHQYCDWEPVRNEEQCKLFEENLY